MSQRSLGSLCSVAKTLIVSLVRQTDQPSKGQGHLLSCSGQLKIPTKPKLVRMIIFWQFKLIENSTHFRNHLSHKGLPTRAMAAGLKCLAENLVTHKYSLGVFFLCSGRVSYSPLAVLFLFQLHWSLPSRGNMTVTRGQPFRN